ncbi:baseplate J-like protein [Halogeometricum borinquense DSM 11551]|uniref:Baseplate J-like protein n=2 Tax=Halogeometricum borinquense TaxID=60847 RepID=E4NVW3_HALBP|nr:putative baseplate assembly protein [Halogeometricum borinquense]ADQ69183.1 Baseplate J-like protein [Halogeometricum borinquense DSM 11551]ELY31735.1 baseplate J-like protein [Halogeometricum borinquense DSM 11551]
MTTPPTIDDREEEDLFDELVDRADVYTDDWDPHTSDTGQTILRIFSTFEADVRNRLNSVPQKHRIGFLNAFGFDRRPPKAARVPLTFHVPGDLDRNVVIPGGTQAVAGAGDTSQLFEVPRNKGFEATGASLTDVIAVDPAEDAIVDHSSVLESTESVELFVGENLQQHHLYVANEDALNLQPGSMLSITAQVDIETEAFADAVVWEYYGEDESGDEGWHPLVPPQKRANTATADSGIEAVKEQLRERDSSDYDTLAGSQSVSGSVAADQSVYEGTFQIPGTITKRSVNGIESRWLRCRLTDRNRDVFSTSVRDLAVHVGSTDDVNGLEPDHLLSNDVPLSTDDGNIKPLGQLPQPPTSFYVACEEAFTKSGGTITLKFHPPEEDSDTSSDESDSTDGSDSAGSSAGRGADIGVIGGEPRLSWEYWNGDGWAQLDSVNDETDTFHNAGTVTFQVPDDIDPTTVSGHENVWIRARLVSGNYGQPSINVPENDVFDGLNSDPDPPVFGDVSIQYEHRGQPFDTVFRHNNASYSDDLTERIEAYAPFQDLPDDGQTVYLGFDDSLHDGPLTLFVPIDDTTYPQSFDPGMEWEYCTSPSEFSWTELDVRDRTGGFTERGIVTLTFPEETTAFDLFGRTRHWIRIRTTQDEFERPETAQQSQGPATARTVADRSSRTTTPPLLEGLHLNTRWAYNKRTIEDEILGSSDGSHDQSFRCAHAPMITIEVWVDEVSTLSAGERRTLLEERPNDVERVFDDRGDLAEFWVRWTNVEDFLDSGPTDRHYVVNKTLGTIEFGNGDNGAIPPSGQDNVRATYTTGGGSDGNVDAGSVSDLKSSISLVDDVSNPESGDGGADVESIDALVSRSANRIKHRGKAVTPSDYEQVALSEFRELSTVKCESTSDGDETRVTVIIVPETERDKPVPSMALKHQVRDVLTDCAPATVVESDDMDIVVRGPGYAEISVQATIRAPNLKSVSLLKQTIRRELDEYLHPLTGKDGKGWSFGELPSSDTLVQRLNDLEEVAETVEATTYVEINGERRALTERTADEILPQNTLVCSGQHDLRITMDME